MSGLSYFFSLSLIISLHLIGTQILQEALADTREIVQINTITEKKANKNVRKVKFYADGEEFEFNFVPSDREVYSSKIPIWVVKSQPGYSPNYTYERIEHTDKVLSGGQFFIDNSKKATVFAHYDKKTQQILYDGLFGESKTRHLIKSLPDNQRSKKKGSQVGNHIIYKVDKSPVKYYVSTKPRRNQNDNPLLVPLERPLETLYPKILAVVDYHLFKKLESNIESVIKYVATFWNAVDQYYIELDSPKIQFILTGIIIAHDERALNYVYQSRNFKNDPYYQVDAQAMQDHMRLYYRYNFSSDIDFQNYDAAVLMTGLHTGLIGGITTLGKICGIWYNIAIVRDDGLYDGVRTATHELAHMLNAKHDKFEHEGLCASFSPDGGMTIMAPAIYDADYIFWSNCSKQSLHEFSTLQAAKCLENRSRVRVYDDDEWF